MNRLSFWFAVIVLIINLAILIHVDDNYRQVAEIMDRMR